jgi:hypothetical protein
MDTENHDFDRLSKGEWIELINRSLKGQSIDDFVWKASEDIPGASITHIDDEVSQSATINRNGSSNDWNTGLDISGQDGLLGLKGIDEIIIDAASANDLSGSDYANSNIIIRFDDEQEFREFGFNKLKEAGCRIQFKDLWNIDPKIIFETLNSAAETSSIGVEIAGFPANGPVVPGLAASLANLVVWLGKLGDKQQQHSFFKKIRLIYCVRTSHILFEIGMIRAIKLLWYNLSKALFDEVTGPEMDIIIHPADLTKESNHQLILGTVASMASIIGGAHTVFVRFEDADHENPEEYQRLFRNIQLILKHESGMASVTDPVAGSYAIEDLTGKIAENTWIQLTGSKDLDLPG